MNNSLVREKLPQKKSKQSKFKIGIVTANKPSIREDMRLEPVAKKIKVKKIVCYVCKREFVNEEILERHNRESKLHLVTA